MTDEAALLRAVLDRPDDDTPRLVYADWCDDNGRPERATFIRAQVEASRVSIDHPKWGVWTRGADALAAVYGDSWVPAELAGRVMWGWERGFVGHIRGIDAADWLAHADAILAAHPVRRVRLTTRPEMRLESLGKGIPVARWEFIGRPGLVVTGGEASDMTLLRLQLLALNWPGIYFTILPTTR